MRAKDYRRLARLLEKERKLKDQLDVVHEELRAFASGHCTTWTQDWSRVTGFYVDSLAELAKACDMEQVIEEKGYVLAPLADWRNNKNRIWLYYVLHKEVAPDV